MVGCVINMSLFELNENTVDEYTAQLETWASGIVERMKDISGQYTEISGKIADVDADIANLKGENKKDNEKYESKVSQIYKKSEEFKTAFGTIHDLHLYILTHESFDCLYRDSYLRLDNKDRAIVDALIEEKEQKSGDYSPRSSVLNRERNEAVYGKHHNLSKEFTQLEKLAVEAWYFPRTFINILNNFGEKGGLFAVHLSEKGLYRPFINQIENLNKIAESVDEETRKKILERRENVYILESSTDFPVLDFDFSRYESLLAQKKQAKQ